MDKDRHQGLEANTAVKTMLGMKDKCCVNVKVYFEIVHVRIRIRIRPYPPFPLTHQSHVGFQFMSWELVQHVICSPSVHYQSHLQHIW